MNGRLGLIALAGLLAVSVAAAAEEDDLMAADRAWAASNADMEKFMTNWAKGASFHAPGMPTLTGAENIGEFLREMRAMPGFALQWTPTKAAVSKSGDLGYTVGTYEMTVNGPDGTPAVENGKYLTVWVKQDGHWKVMEDIFNSDSDAPE